MSRAFLNTDLVYCTAAVESQQGGLELWQGATKAIQESEGKFSEKHIHYACVHAYNFGVKAWYYGRMQDAEQWLAIAWKLSTSLVSPDPKSRDSIMDDPTKDKIRQAYELVVSDASLAGKATSSSLGKTARP